MARKESESLEEKFWRKVEKGQNKDDCWKWTASKYGPGYGQIAHTTKGKGKSNLKGHRVSYFIHFGEIPRGMIVCHKCSNRECTNPRHLYLSTWRDNVRDLMKKGVRFNTAGEGNGQSKLTMEIAREIRSLATQFTQAELARQFCVTQTSIGRVIRNETWKESRS